MDNSDILNLLNSTLWKDYKGFLRDEKRDNNPTEKELNKFLSGSLAVMFFGLIFVGLIGAVVLDNDKAGLVAAIVLEVVYIAVCFGAFIKIVSDRNEISTVAYDIESTPHKVKIIRNRAGKLGLCYWNNYIDNKLLLRCDYDKIEEEGENIYILYNSQKYGLYNAELRRIIADCKNERIERVSEKTYNLFHNNHVEKMNSNGDRMPE